MQLEELFLKLIGTRRGGKSEPEPIPEHLSALVSDILHLDVLKEAGATFSYPDALAPLQWAGLEALTNARRRRQGEERESQQRQQDRDDQRAKLQKLAHGL